MNWEFIRVVSHARIRPYKGDCRLEKGDRYERHGHGI